MTKFDDARDAGYITLSEIPDEVLEELAVTLGTTVELVKDINIVWVYDEDEGSLLHGIPKAFDANGATVLAQGDVQTVINNYLAKERGTS